MLKKLIPLAFIIASVLILYHPVLDTYFSHDDFFHFKVSQAEDKPGGYLYFLGFHPFEERGIAFYRPIFREFIYGPFYQIFGINPVPFRFLQMLIHYINIFLLFVFLKQLFKNKYLPYLASFFFAISASNVSTLYYLAGGIQTLGATMLILLTLLFFQNYLGKKQQKYKYLSFVTFILGLASHEQAGLIPLLLLGLVFIKYNFRKFPIKAFQLAPYFLITGIYIYLNFTKIGYSASEIQYQPSLNIKSILNSYAWYGGWALGLPEMLIDFVPPGLKLDPRLMRYWGEYFRIIFPAFIVSSVILAVFTLYLLFKKRNVLFDKRLWFFILWFPLGLLPVIILPQHKSGHYLYVSLPAFWSFMGIVIVRTFNQLKIRQVKLAGFIFGVFFITLFSLSATSAKLGNKTYWAAARGRLAEILIKDVKSKYPTLPKGATIYFKNDPDYPFVSEDWGGTSKQAYFALNNQDALQLLYQDPTLKVFYEDFNLIDSNLQPYIITAKFE